MGKTGIQWQEAEPAWQAALRMEMSHRHPGKCQLSQLLRLFRGEVHAQSSDLELCNIVSGN